MYKPFTYNDLRLLIKRRPAIDTIPDEEDILGLRRSRLSKSTKGSRPGGSRAYFGSSLLLLARPFFHDFPTSRSSYAPLIIIRIKRHFKRYCPSGEDISLIDTTRLNLSRGLALKGHRDMNLSLSWLYDFRIRTLGCLVDPCQDPEELPFRKGASLKLPGSILPPIAEWALIADRPWLSKEDRTYRTDQRRWKALALSDMKRRSIVLLECYSTRALSLNRHVHSHATGRNGESGSPNICAVPAWMVRRRTFGNSADISWYRRLSRPPPKLAALLLSTPSHHVFIRHAASLVPGKLSTDQFMIVMISPLFCRTGIWGLQVLSLHAGFTWIDIVLPSIHGNSSSIWRTEYARTAINLKWRLYWQSLIFPYALTDASEEFNQ